METSWKDDVLQLQAQLYYAWCSLQRPFEDTRSQYREEAQWAGEVAVVDVNREGGNNQAGEMEARIPLQVQSAAKRRRLREPGYQCRHCKSGKLFYDHGLQSHLLVYLSISLFPLILTQEMFAEVRPMASMCRQRVFL